MHRNAMKVWSTVLKGVRCATSAARSCPVKREKHFELTIDYRRQDRRNILATAIAHRTDDTIQDRKHSLVVDIAKRVRGGKPQNGEQANHSKHSGRV